jgi:hypothetical protein
MSACRNSLDETIIFNENFSEFIFESVNGVAPNTGKDYFAMGINS